jgi:hypothetical protein
VSTPIDDGGPAFPHGEIVEDIMDEAGRLAGSRVWAPSKGMKLRDWLATHATEADIEEHRNYRFCPQTKCVLSRRTREAAKYAYADEMIRTRKGGTDANR